MGPYNGFMKSGRTNPALLAAILVATLGAFIGIAFIATSFFTGIKKQMEVKQKEREASDDMIDSIKKYVTSQELGQRPKFPDSPLGRVQSIAYDLVLLQVARGREFEDRLKKSGYDFVMTPESLQSKAGLEKSLRLIDEARAITDWLYAGMKRDIAKTIEKMKAAGQGSKDAETFISAFEAAINNPDGTVAMNDQIREELRKNHDALTNCVNFLLREYGQFSVDTTGSVVFQAGFPDYKMEEYNTYVKATTDTMAEIDRLEQRKLALMNSVINR